MLPLSADPRPEAKRSAGIPVQRFHPHEVFHQSITFTDGYLHRGDEPGPGVIFHEEAARAYPYQQAHLADNRLQDGTVHE